MLVQDEDWVPAIEGDGTAGDGAWLVKLSDLIDHHWVDDVRVIARRERPRPSAQGAAGPVRGHSPRMRDSHHAPRTA